MPSVLPGEYVPNLVDVVASQPDAALPGAAVWTRASEVQLSHDEIRQLGRLSVDAEVEFRQAEFEPQAVVTQPEVVHGVGGHHLGYAKRRVSGHGVIQVGARRQHHGNRRVLRRP